MTDSVRQNARRKGSMRLAYALLHLAAISPWQIANLKRMFPCIAMFDSGITSGGES